MAGRSKAHQPAPALVVLGAMLAAGNWYLQPDRFRAWAATLLLIGCMAAMLVLVRGRRHEAAWRRAGDSIRSAIAFAGLLLSISLGLKLARALGAIADADLSRRATMAILGAFFVFTGNGFPKTLTPLSELHCDAAAVQAFQRTVGWTWVLTGIGFAVTWLVLPLDLATPVSMLLLVCGMLTVLAQIVRLRRSGQRKSGHAT